MTPVFQNKFGVNNGNCMQAVVASILNLSLDSVPEFKGGDGITWWEQYLEFMRTNGYEFDKLICNPKQLGGYGVDELSELKEGKYIGIGGGYFYASVYSPGLFDRINFIHNKQYNAPHHAVIVDRELNIVHDPHPHYQGVKQYPLHEWIGYNGVLSVDIFKPIIAADK